jgi:hypothetical protein
MLEKKGFSEWMSFEDMEVEAHFKRRDRNRLMNDKYE